MRLKSELARRRFGVVSAAYESRIEASDDPRKDLDRVSTFLGLTPLKECYMPVERKDAEAELARVLEKDQAYETECLPTETAKRLASEFIGLFGPRARFFWNVDRVWEDGTKSWLGVSRATFDRAIYAADDSAVGFVCVQDED
ncbi:MAG: hypothetical protein ACHQ51_14635 [Elusimicrobiota bacterium]